MSIEMEELEKWKQMPDWNEKLTAYSGGMNIVEINAHIEILKLYLDLITNPPDSLLLLYAHFIGRALMNIAQNLQNQTHNF